MRRHPVQVLESLLLPLMALAFVTSDAAMNASKAHLLVDWMPDGAQKIMMAYSVVAVAIAIAFMPFVLSLEGTQESNAQASIFACVSVVISLVALLMFSQQMTANHENTDGLRSRLEEELGTQQYRDQKIEECLKSRYCVSEDLRKNYREKLDQLAGLPASESSQESSYYIAGITVTLLTLKKILGFCFAIAAPFGASLCTQRLVRIMNVNGSQGTLKVPKREPYSENGSQNGSQGSKSPKTEGSQAGTARVPKTDPGTVSAKSNASWGESQRKKMEEAYTWLTKNHIKVTAAKIQERSGVGRQVSQKWFKHGTKPNITSIKKGSKKDVKDTE